MSRDNAIRLTFIGIALFLIVWLAEDGIISIASSFTLPSSSSPWNRYSPIADFVEQGWLKAICAAIVVVGAYFWNRSKAP